MSNKPDNVVFIKLSNYIKPEIQETYLAGKKWIHNGKNNEFFRYIIDRYNGSPTNSAIINSYADLCYGRGLAIKETGNPVDEKFYEMISKEDFRRIIKDYILFTSSTVTIDRDSKKIEHIPREAVAPNQMDLDTGEIQGHWHCYDWRNQWRYKPQLYKSYDYKTKLSDKEINAKHELNEDYEILVIQPYQPGKKYFSDPEYLSALQYAEMEEEMSNYSINHIKSGLSFGYIINFNNGSNLSDEEKDKFVKKITEKLTGSSNAGRFIASFNDDKDSAITIEPFTITDAHEQWQWLSKEAENKLIRAHRVTNPIIVGIKDNVGLGNNADEMDVSEHQLMKRVIAPKQEVLLDALKKPLKEFGWTKELFFLPLTELDEDGDTVDKDGDKVSKKEKPNTKEDVKTELNSNYIKLVNLGEEEQQEDWDIISDEVVNYDTCDLLDDNLLSLSIDNTDVGKKSEQDRGLYKIRYKYSPVKVSSNSREFCKDMVSANKVYRKEDIQKANSLIENPGWGEYGTEQYSLWLFKGGGDCHHSWRRLVYFRKRNSNGSFMKNKGLDNDKKVTVTSARNAGVEITRNEIEVAKKPKNMEKRGFLHKFKEFISSVGINLNQTYDYGCIMLGLSFKGNLWNNVLDIVDKKDVYDIENEKYGLEKEPHITLLYGLHDNSKPKEIFSSVGSILKRSVDIELSELDVFENEDYDVLVFKINNQTLNNINEKLKKDFDYTNSYDEYKAHATIGYLKKGMGKKYLRKEMRIEANGNTLLLSESDGKKYTQKLN